MFCPLVPVGIPMALKELPSWNSHTTFKIGWRGLFRDIDHG
jgi:hypothetical protein